MEGIVRETVRFPLQHPTPAPTYVGAGKREVRENCVFPKTLSLFEIQHFNNLAIK
jgi:hypothetical protein